MLGPVALCLAEAFPYCSNIQDGIARMDGGSEPFHTLGSERFADGLYL